MTHGEFTTRPRRLRLLADLGLRICRSARGSAWLDYISRPSQTSPRKSRLLEDGAAGHHTLKQIAAELAESPDLSKTVAKAVMGDLVTLTTRHLKQGDKIRLTGLGILQVKGYRLEWGFHPA